MKPQEIQEAQSAMYALIAVAVPVIIIVALLILYHVTAKKAHKQNMRDINNRYTMPKK